jgi:uncharacterized membrane protein YeaQ/YmgE (transglycosylase-associated protein family)
MFMATVGWIIVGLMTGFLTSKAVNLRGDAPGIGICLGAVGAVIGGWLYIAISGAEVAGVNGVNLLAAAAGAGVALMIWHAMRWRAAPHD